MKNIERKASAEEDVFQELIMLIHAEFWMTSIRWVCCRNYRGLNSWFMGPGLQPVPANRIPNAALCWLSQRIRQGEHCRSISGGGGGRFRTIAPVPGLEYSCRRAQFLLDILEAEPNHQCWTIRPAETYRLKRWFRRESRENAYGDGRTKNVPKGFPEEVDLKPWKSEKVYMMSLQILPRKNRTGTTSWTCWSTLWV